MMKIGAFAFVVLKMNVRLVRICMICEHEEISMLKRLFYLHEIQFNIKGL